MLRLRNARAFIPIQEKTCCRDERTRKEPANYGEYTILSVNMNVWVVLPEKKVAN